MYVVGAVLFDTTILLTILSWQPDNISKGRFLHFPPWTPVIAIQFVASSVQRFYTNMSFDVGTFSSPDYLLFFINKIATAK